VLGSQLGRWAQAELSRQVQVSLRGRFVNHASMLMNTTIVGVPMGGMQMTNGAGMAGNGMAGTAMPMNASAVPVMSTGAVMPAGGMLPAASYGTNVGYGGAAVQQQPMAVYPQAGIPVQQGVIGTQPMMAQGQAGMIAEPAAAAGQAAQPGVNVQPQGGGAGTIIIQPGEQDRPRSHRRSPSPYRHHHHRS
jgi:hypothetical protein